VRETERDQIEQILYPTHPPHHLFLTQSV